jgi:PadR family transcriptional regulator AphA
MGSSSRSKLDGMSRSVSAAGEAGNAAGAGLPSLSPSSYLVLGLIARHGPMTPYELKTRSAESVGHFWSFPHAQLYNEPDRLARSGLLGEERETEGRRRRTFHLLPAGRKALEEWLADPETEHAQLRDPALLKLSLSGLGGPKDIQRLAERQLEVHRERLADYRRRAAELGDEAGEHARRLLLDIGQRIEEAHVDFWGNILDRSE